MDRPKLKGVIHAVFALLYLGLLPELISRIPSSVGAVFGLYLFGLVGHFVASATLHLIPWRNPSVFRKIDHAMIFVFIYSAYMAIVTTAIPFVNPMVIYFLQTGTALGIIMRIFFTDLHPILVGTPYVMVGWSILLDPATISYGFEFLPEAASLCLLMGITYTIGALIYILRWPNPCPTYMGFHEIFHVFSALASIILTHCIFEHCLPHYLNNT